MIYTDFLTRYNFKQMNYTANTSRLKNNSKEPLEAVFIKNNYRKNYSQGEAG